MKSIDKILLELSRHSPIISSFRGSVKLLQYKEDAFKKEKENLNEELTNFLKEYAVKATEIETRLKNYSLITQFTKPLPDGIKFIKNTINKMKEIDAERNTTISDVLDREMFDVVNLLQEVIDDATKNIDDLSTENTRLKEENTTLKLKVEYIKPISIVEATEKIIEDDVERYLRPVQVEESENAIKAD